MNDKKISVIIPCYNAEKYIDRCMQSIVNQSFDRDKIEIILINDASSDKTMERLLEWEKRYEENVLVIDNQENAGCGGARNIGVEYATAEYVFFLDADDWIEKDALQDLYICSKREYYDIVSGKLIFERKDQKIDMDIMKEYEESHRQDSYYEAKKKGDFYIWDMKAVFTGNVGGFPTSTGALYRRRLLVENGLFFPEKTDYEDNLWRELLKLYFSNMYILDKIIYHYCYNDNSITQKRNNINFEDRLGNELKILDEYMRMGAYKYYKEDLEYNFIRRFYLNTIFVIFTTYDYIPDLINYLKNTVVRLFPEYKKNRIYGELKPREERLMKLLDLQKNITEEDMIKIKGEYLSELARAN